MMIGNITKKTMILSPPTTPHNKEHSDLFYFGESIVAVVKLSHNLQAREASSTPSSAEQLLKMKYKGYSMFPSLH